MDRERRSMRHVAGCGIEIYNIYTNYGDPSCCWELHYFGDALKESPETMQKIEAFRNFLKRHEFVESPDYCGPIVSLDVNLLSSDQRFLHEWPEFRDDLKNLPKYTLNCLQFGLHKTVQEWNTATGSTECDAKVCVKLRIRNFRPAVTLRDATEDFHGRLVCTSGCVYKMRTSKIQQRLLVFSCTKCDGQQLLVANGPRKRPEACSVCACRTFEREIYSAYARNVTIQTIVLQERADVTEFGSLTIPTSIDVQLTNDLVNCCLPGDSITVTGIIDMKRCNASTSRSPTMSVEAVSVTNHGSNANVRDSKLDPRFGIVEEIKKQEDVFRLLVHSLCPDVHGHEIVKAALLLSLFAGTRADDRVREYLHVLLVTDPGFAKARLLQCCATVAPKGIYVRASHCAKSSLTITCVQGRDDECTVIAGSLVLTNDGVCCIDELENVSSQYQALTMALDRREVHILNADLACCLPARTSIVASVKPTNGHYNRAKTIVQNLNVGQALLSHFDLVFVMGHHQDQEYDRFMCERVIRSRSKGSVTPSTSGTTFASGRSRATPETSSLKKRLMLFADENVDVVPPEGLKMYIRYAKEHVKPVLTPEVTTKLRNYVLEFCNERSQKNAGVRIGSYPFRTLQTLTEARAKVELREEATESDASEAIEIYDLMRSDISDTRQFGNIITEIAKGKPTKNKVKRFLSLLKEESNVRNKTLFSLTELSDIAKKGDVAIDDFNDFVASLNEAGYLLKLPNRTYRITV